MQNFTSEVTAFRQQQALREQAGQQGLSGLTIVANHEAINVRMERVRNVSCILFEQGNMRRRLH